MLRVYNNRHGSVVHQRHFHIGAEDARLYPFSQVLAHRFAKRFIEWHSYIRLCSADIRGPIALLYRGVKRELTDDKQLAFHILHGAIHHALCVVDWIKTYGVRYFSELTNMAILTEEVGEVARIMARRYGEQSFKASDAKHDLADEMADVLWVLVCLANQTGVDLTEAFERNLKKKTERDNERHLHNQKLQ